MSTLYLRNVPAEVAAQLAVLAQRNGMSVSAFAVRELAHVARRANNTDLLADLPDLGITPETVVDAIAESRPER